MLGTAEDVQAEGLWGDEGTEQEGNGQSHLSLSLPPPSEQPQVFCDGDGSGHLSPRHSAQLQTRSISLCFVFQWVAPGFWCRLTFFRARVEAMR